MKRPTITITTSANKSLPSRERELKQDRPADPVCTYTSLPSRERELKQQLEIGLIYKFWSLPSRERELKHIDNYGISNLYQVAPFTGARVETPRNILCAME